MRIMYSYLLSLLYHNNTDTFNIIIINFSCQVRKNGKPEPSLFQTIMKQKAQNQKSVPPLSRIIEKNFPI